VLVDSVEIEGQGERAERAAYREAEKLRTKLLADADAGRVAEAGSPRRLGTHSLLGARQRNPPACRNIVPPTDNRGSPRRATVDWPTWTEPESRSR
jgi:hypothetical protein